MWVSGIIGTEGVAFSDELESDVRKVGDEVRDVAGGDEMFASVEENVAELGFTDMNRGREL